MSIPNLPVAKSMKSPIAKLLPEEKEYDIDFVGTGTDIHLHNIMQRRNVEPVKRVEGNLIVAASFYYLFIYFI